MGILLAGKQESLWSFLIVPSPLAKLYITFDLLHSFNLSIASAENLRKSAGTRTLSSFSQYIENKLDSFSKLVLSGG